MHLPFHIRIWYDSILKLTLTEVYVPKSASSKEEIELFYKENKMTADFNAKVGNGREENVLG